MIRPRIIKRETLAVQRDAGKIRRVVIVVDPVAATVGFKLKGCRRTYALPADHLWWYAMKSAVAAEKREKAKAKKGKSK